MNAASTRSLHVGKWAVWLIAALSIYVLSIGPVSGWVTAHPPSEFAWKVLDRVYHPVEWCCDTSAASGRALLFYEQWCEDHMGSPAPPGHIFLRRRPGAGETFLGEIVIPKQILRHE